MNKIEIKPFNKLYQDRCKEIILLGLEEHWGFLDETLNTDLNDIETNYSNDIFLTAWIDGQLIGTGAAKLQYDQTVEIVRMYVIKEHRSRGVGKQLINTLIAEVQKFGSKKIILETTTEWIDVVHFYLKNGFIKTEIKSEDTLFEKILN